MFSWFTRKSKSEDPDTLVGLRAEANSDPRKHKVSSSLPVSQSDTALDVSYDKTAKRQLKRKQLFVVIRDVLLQAGVHSGNFKFKVLSLDSSGKQYLVMIELAWLNDGEGDRLAEIENLIAKRAKAEHGLIVTAVYWRATPSSEAASGRETSRPVYAVAPAAKSPGVLPVMKDAYQPIDPGEMLAFKEALSTVRPRALSEPGEIIQSGRRNPAPEPNFGDTEISDHASPLSGTQYGDLI